MIMRTPQYQHLMAVLRVTRSTALNSKIFLVGSSHLNKMFQHSYSQYVARRDTSQFVPFLYLLVYTDLYFTSQACMSQHWTCLLLLIPVQVPITLMLCTWQAGCLTQHFGSHCKVTKPLLWFNHKATLSGSNFLLLSSEQQIAGDRGFIRLEKLLHIQGIL